MPLLLDAVARRMVDEETNRCQSNAETDRSDSCLTPTGQPFTEQAMLAGENGDAMLPAESEEALRQKAVAGNSRSRCPGGIVDCP